MSPFAGPSRPFCKAQLQDKVQIEALLQGLSSHVVWRPFLKTNLLGSPFSRLFPLRPQLLEVGAGLVLLFLLLLLGFSQPSSSGAAFGAGLAFGLSQLSSLLLCACPPGWSPNQFETKAKNQLEKPKQSGQKTNP